MKIDQISRGKNVQKKGVSFAEIGCTSYRTLINSQKAVFPRGFSRFSDICFFCGLKAKRARHDNPTSKGRRWHGEASRRQV